MNHSIKPLPGQMPLFDLPTTDTDEIQRRAARRNDPQCAWGDCPEPATHTHKKTGEKLCALHIQWFLKP